MLLCGLDYVPSTERAFREPHFPPRDPRRNPRLRWLRGPGQCTLQFLLLLAYHPVAVRVLHELVGRASPVERCYTVGPGLGASDPSGAAIAAGRRADSGEVDRLMAGPPALGAVPTGIDSGPVPASY